jgi:hypothetical protein
MEVERPLLSDAEFLRLEGVGADDEPLWLAVRRAMADSLGLPSEAIYPEDRLADLLRMQWGIPDLLDPVFRLERSLGVRITRESVGQLWSDVSYGQAGEFRQFAAAMVEELREALKVGAVS